jgi:hypothetical protein
MASEANHAVIPHKPGGDSLHKNMGSPVSPIEAEHPEEGALVNFHLEDSSQAPSFLGWHHGRKQA